MDIPELGAKPLRYRFISPLIYLTGPVAFLVALRASILLAVIVLIVLTGLVALLLRVGSDMTTEGIVVRHVRGSTLVPWQEIAGVTTMEDWNFGQRIVVVRRDGQRVVVPAPTSKTGRFAKGLSRVQAEVAKLR